MKVIKQNILGIDVYCVKIGKNVCWHAEVNGSNYGSELIGVDEELEKIDCLLENAKETIEKLHESNITV